METKKVKMEDGDGFVTEIVNGNERYPPSLLQSISCWINKLVIGEKSGPVLPGHSCRQQQTKKKRKRIN